MNKKINEEKIMDLADSIGEFIQYWGFKAIEGKIWAYVFLMEGPICASDLVEKFDCSKTLMSFAVKRLLEYDVLQEEGRGERGKMYLTANTNIFGVITGVLKARELKLLENVINQIQNIETDLHNLSSTRFKYLQRFVKNAHFLLRGLIMAKDINLKKFFIGNAPAV